MAAAHWAIRPDVLRRMFAIAARMNVSLDAIEADRGKPLDNTYCVTVRDGVATIPVHGPLFRYADYFSWVSGAATYESLSEDFITTLKDPDIKAILWDFDTPGGEVHGCQQFARLIASARATSGKPMAVYGAGDVCSAGYWSASAVGRLVVAPTALVGSIGCCATITDFSQWQADQGIEEIQIVSSQSPRKNRDVKSEEGRADVQEVLDALADVFIADAAEFRDVTVEKVLKDFGQGGVLVGAAAVAAGLADVLGTYDDVHAELRDRADGTHAIVVPLGTARASTTVKEDSSMTAPKKVAAGAQPAATTEPSAETDPNAPVKDEEMDEEKKKKDEEQPAARVDTAKVAKTAAEKERARIRGIQELQRHASEQAIIDECIDDGSTVEQAALKLRKAEAKSSEKHLAALRASEKENPAPAAGGGDEGEPTVESLSDFIVNAGKPADQRSKR